MKKSTRNAVSWTLGLLTFFGIAAMIYSSFTLRIIGLWAAILFGLFGASCIIYSFAGVFAKKTFHKCIITGIIMCSCILIYYRIHNPPDKVQRMQEDVLYIHPKSTAKTNDEIYDGSKTDPNMKEDTINNK